MNRAELPIASPCPADWTKMTLADRGRFCGQCKKVVRELAQLSEAEARALLASPPTEGLCVRYVHDATGEIIFRQDVVPLGRLARAKKAAAVALAAAALPVAVAGCMGAAPMPPPVMGAVAEPQPTDMVMGTVAAPPPAPSGSAYAPAPPNAPPPVLPEAH